MTIKRMHAVLWVVGITNAYKRPRAYLGCLKLRVWPVGPSSECIYS
jgi:hypothetical protein